MNYRNVLYSIVMLPAISFAFMSGIDESRDTQGELEISGAYIPLGPPGMMSVGYLKITNTSDEDIGFDKFSSPVFDSVEVHGTEHKNGVARMTHLKSLIIPANSTVELKPGHTHLMLVGPRRDIKAGENIMMIGLGFNEKRYMIKFRVIDPRDDHTDHTDHSHHSHHNH